MSITRLYGAKGTGANTATNTYFENVINGFRAQAVVGVVANSQSTWRTAGTLSNMYYGVYLNTVTATSTYTLQVGGSNVNQAVSFASSTTGSAEDKINTDAISSGNLVNVKLVVGGTGTSLTSAVSAIDFQTAGLAFSQTGFSTPVFAPATASTSFFFSFGGANTVTSPQTEAQGQKKVYSATTLQNMDAYSSSNSRASSTTTIVTRIAGVNGNLTISYAASTNGLASDTTHTDSVSANTLICGAAGTGAGTGTITIQMIKVEEVTVDNSYAVYLGAGTTTGLAIPVNTTAYSDLSGTPIAATTESQMQQITNSSRVGYPALFKNMGVFVNSNANTGTSVFTFRQNAANTALTVSFASSTTGLAEDITHKAQLVAGDLINTSIVTPNSGGSLAFGSQWFQKVIQNPSFLPFV